MQFSGESLSFARTQEHRVSVDHRLMVSSDSVCHCSSALLHFLLRSWIINLSEEEAFADQRLCCNTQTINNEERYPGPAVFGQVQAGLK